MAADAYLYHQGPLLLILINLNLSNNFMLGLKLIPKSSSNMVLTEQI